jgi:hypothetical protein
MTVGCQESHDFASGLLGLDSESPVTPGFLSFVVLQTVKQIHGLEKPCSAISSSSNRVRCAVPNARWSNPR